MNNNGKDSDLFWLGFGAGFITLALLLYPMQCLANWVHP